jgi:hypothetical protein
VQSAKARRIERNPFDEQPVLLFLSGVSPTRRRAFLSGISLAVAAIADPDLSQMVVLVSGFLAQALSLACLLAK